MALIDRLISKKTSCDTLKSGSGIQGYTHGLNTCNDNETKRNPNVTFVSFVTGEQNQAVMERPKEWFSALDLLEKTNDFLARLYDADNRIYQAIESDPILLKNEDAIDALAIQIKDEPDQAKRQALLDKLTIACRFRCKKVKAYKEKLASPL